jgi:hypothetical protein
MIRALLHRSIRRFERHYGYDATYMHEILDASLRAFLKLMLAQALNAHRDAAAPEAIHAARIVAARHEDCGPCAQLTVNMALEAGIDPTLVRAIVARDLTRLTPDATLGLRLAEAALLHENADDVRAEVLARWGRRGLVCLAYAVAGTRTYPTMKRVLGHAHVCERLVVQGETVPVARAA